MRARAVALAAAMTATTLGACRKEQPVIPTTRSALADSANQIMSRVQFLLTGGGVQQGRLVADSAFLFENSTRVELRGVRTDFFAKTGEQTGTLTSREGTYREKSGNLEARKDVVVISADGQRRLETQQLQFDERTNLITTDSAFVITQDGQVARGVGFSTDPDVTRFECKGSCSGNFNMARRSPPPGSSP